MCLSKMPRLTRAECGLGLGLLISAASSLFSHGPNWPIFAGQVDLLFDDQAKTESKRKT